MTKTEQRKLLGKVKTFLKKNKIDITDVNFRTGDEGLTYSEFATDGQPFMSFEGDLYHLLNYAQDGYKFYDKFCNFLEGLGYYFELGHAWNLTIYEV
jgi:hypothetical protein